MAGGGHITEHNPAAYRFEQSCDLELHRADIIAEQNSAERGRGCGETGANPARLTLYRIEDADRRGPFKPGFSRTWRDHNGPDLPPPWIEAGISIAQFIELFADYKHCGCACRSEAELNSWFSRAERKRLTRHGYRTVSFVPDAILLETPTQVVFGMSA